MKRRALLAGAAALACTAALPEPHARERSDRAAELMTAMSMPDRAAQTMSVAFRGTRITPHLERMIREIHVGAVILFTENAADAGALRSLTADLQAIAREAGIPPLLLSIDHEGGPVIRVGQGLAILPAQMALAATPDPPASVRRSALIAARELRACGVNMVWAPVADVNDEPRNPIIGSRAYGSDPRRVGELVAAAVRAYAEGGLLCCAKHFPGHGSATIDSHLGLPTLPADRARLDAVELVPFRSAIAADVPAIMSAHIALPAIDASGQPATLSSAFMTRLLREELGFRGLAVSDDLEMRGLAQAGGAPRAGRAALAAGADLLLFRFDPETHLAGHRLLADSVADGSLAAGRVDEAATRVLRAKLRGGLLAATTQPWFDLAADQAEALDLARQSTTLLRAEGLPLRGRVLAVSFGRPDIAVLPGQPTFADVVAREVPGARAVHLARIDPAGIARAVATAADADRVVVGTHDALGDPRQVELVRGLRQARPTVVVSQRGPYDILAFPEITGYLAAYSGREPAVVAAVEVMTGSRAPVGRLPVEIPGLHPLGAGLAKL